MRSPAISRSVELLSAVGTGSQPPANASSPPRETLLESAALMTALETVLFLFCRLLPFPPSSMSEKLRLLRPFALAMSNRLFVDRLQMWTALLVPTVRPELLSSPKELFMVPFEVLKIRVLHFRVPPTLSLSRLPGGSSNAHLKARLALPVLAEGVAMLELDAIRPAILSCVMCRLAHRMFAVEAKSRPSSTALRPLFPLGPLLRRTCTWPTFALVQTTGRSLLDAMHPRILFEEDILGSQSTPTGPAPMLVGATFRVAYLF